MKKNIVKGLAIIIVVGTLIATGFFVNNARADHGDPPEAYVPTQTDVLLS